MCTINDNHMMYGSRDMERNGADFFSISDERPGLVIQDLYHLKKISIVVIQDLIAISITFFTELSIVVFRLLFVLNNRCFISRWCVLRMLRKRREEA